MSSIGSGDLCKFDILMYPESAALAQHHGIPTRLLDFTLNPLIAAYFSIIETSDSDSGEVIHSNFSDLQFLPNQNCLLILVDKAKQGFFIFF